MYGGRRDKQGCVTVMQGCVTVMQGCVMVVAIAGPPRISRDHDGLFQGLTTFHHGRPKLADPWLSVIKIVTV